MVTITGATAIGRRSVNVVPRPTVLSTRMRPLWASMISLQRASPARNRPAVLIRGLGRVEPFEDLGELVRRDSWTGITDGDLTGPRFAVPGDTQEQRSAGSHRLPSVDDQIDQHLLDLSRIDLGPRVVVIRRFETNAIDLQVLLDQDQHVLGQLSQRNTSRCPFPRA